MIPKNFDLRHIDTRDALTDEERNAVRRQRQREELRLDGPRVALCAGYIPPAVARQFHHIEWIRGAA